MTAQEKARQLLSLMPPVAHPLPRALRVWPRCEACGKTRSQHFNMKHCYLHMHINGCTPSVQIYRHPGEPVFGGFDA